MEKQLNAYLSDLILESHKLQGLHWYVKGKDFFWAHAKLEELYKECSLMIDEVAEAMLMCSMKPVATMKDIMAAATLKEAKVDFTPTADAFAMVMSDYEQLLESVKTIKEKAEANSEELLSIKSDTHIELLSKALWMMRQSQE